MTCNKTAVFTFLLLELTQSIVDVGTFGNGEFSKWYIFTLQEKSNFLVMHSFTKCFSDTRANQTVNKLLLVLSLHFVVTGSVKNVLEIVYKNVFEIMTLPNNLVFICRFTGSIVLDSIHSLWFTLYDEICVCCQNMVHGNFN